MTDHPVILTVGAANRHLGQVADRDGLPAMLRRAAAELRSGQLPSPLPSPRTPGPFDQIRDVTLYTGDPAEPGYWQTAQLGVAGTTSELADLLGATADHLAGDGHPQLIPGPPFPPGPTGNATADLAAIRHATRAQQVIVYIGEPPPMGPHPERNAILNLGQVTTRGELAAMLAVTADEIRDGQHIHLPLDWAWAAANPALGRRVDPRISAEDIATAFGRPDPQPRETSATPAGNRPPIVIVDHGPRSTGRSDVTVYGPFTTQDTAGHFADVMSREVDPARLAFLADPVREALSIADRQHEEISGADPQ